MATKKSKYNNIIIESNNPSTCLSVISWSGDFTHEGEIYVNDRMFHFTIASGYADFWAAESGPKTATRVSLKTRVNKDDSPYNYRDYLISLEEWARVAPYQVQ